MGASPSTGLCQFVHAGTVVSSAGITRNCLNSFCYDVSDTLKYLVVNKPTIVTQWVLQIGSNIFPNLSNRLLGQSTGLWLVQIPGDSITFFATSSSGTVTGDSMPVNVAAFSSLRTGFRGLNLNGKKYWPAIPRSYVTGDELNATGQAAFATIATFIKKSFSVTIGGHKMGLSPVCWSRVLSAANPPPAAQQIALIQDSWTDITLSTWRHRREPTQR